MGSATLILSTLAVFLVIQWTEAGSVGTIFLNSLNPRCPTPSRVYSIKPSCRDDYDCQGGRVCCPNQGGALSCAEPAPPHQRPTYDYKNKSAKRYKRASILGGPGIYCGSVKCKPSEKCIRDPYTAKLVCRRK